MMTTRRWAMSICLLLLVVVLDSCKKEEEPKTRPQKKVRRKEASKKASEKALTKEEQSAIANQRLMEAMKTRKAPFDRIKAVRNELFTKYDGLDLKTMFDEKALADVTSGGDLRYLFMDLKSASEVRLILEDEAAKQVEPNWSPERLEKVRKTANEKFRHYKLEEVIEAKVKRPNGSLRSVKGRLISVTSKVIVVGGQRIPVQDLSSPPRWAFDFDNVRRRRNNYIYNAFTRPKSEEKNVVKEKIAPEIYKRYGCINKDGKWISVKQLLVKEIEPAIDALEEAHEQAERERFMKEIFQEMLKEGLLNQ